LGSGDKSVVALAPPECFAHYRAKIRVALREESMAEADELDQADEEMQPDLFGAEPVPAYRPDPERVRARLHKILAEARAAQSLPWAPGRVSLYRTIFPQMTNWLPEDEGAQLRFEFETELARLEAA
jgi:hypothetical protein